MGQTDSPLYYLMPSGNWPSQNGLPVLIDINQFTECCCELEEGDGWEYKYGSFEWERLEGPWCTHTRYGIPREGCYAEREGYTDEQNARRAAIYAVSGISFKTTGDAPDTPGCGDCMGCYAYMSNPSHYSGPTSEQIGEDEWEFTFLVEDCGQCEDVGMNYDDIRVKIRVVRCTVEPPEEEE